MKNFLKLIFASFLLTGLLFANGIDQNGSKDGYDIELKSDKNLVVGTNKMFVKLSKDGNYITDAKVKIKFFMPEMPGMPYMEYEDKAKLVGDKYMLNINFSMGGTWQYQLKFKTSDDKVHTVRGSVNL